jgi:predicted kinase
MKILHMLIGLPRSGKSTEAKKPQQEYLIPVIRRMDAQWEKPNNAPNC